MSGSDAKRKRRQERADGLDKWQAKEQEQQAEKKKVRRTLWIATPIVVIVLAFIILLNSSLPYSKWTAVQIGDTAFTAGDYNYYYQTVYGNFQNTYSSVLSEALDSSTPLDQQMFDENQTWADYFKSMTLATMKETAALCEAAAKDGFTLTEDQLADIDDQIQQMSVYFMYYGAKNADQYFSTVYGRGVDEATFRRNVEMVLLSDAYGQHVQDTAPFSQEEVTTEYNENPDNYDKVVYRYYYFSSGTSSDTEASERETAMGQAKTKAEAFAAYATTEEKFMARALELMEADDTKTETDITPYRYSSGTLRRYVRSTLASSYAEWLTDASRAYGDVDVVESSNGYAVLFYISADDGKYETRNIRNLLIEVGEDGEDDEPGTALQEAYDKAESYLDEWEENGGTEEAFGEVAHLYSYDTDTYEEGGLMQNVYKGQLVPEAEEWVYDSARKAGDTVIVEGEDGLHVLYYIGESGEQYWYQAALQSLQSNYFDTWKTELVDSYTVTEKIGMKFVNK